MHNVVEKIEAQVRPSDGFEILSDIFGGHLNAARAGSLPIVLFCAGSSGEILFALFRKYDISPVCFCDNNQARVGTVFCGLPVVSFETLKSVHRNSLIVIASTAFHKTVRRQLLENGFDDHRIVVLEKTSASLDRILKNERVMMFARNGEPDNLIGQMQKDEERISAAYHLLSDEKSKSLFIDRLALTASGYDYASYKEYLARYSEPILRYGYDNPARLQYGGVHFYFDNDILEIEADEVLVDGGAYIGDSAESFVRACRQRAVSYKQIHCFEADTANYRELIKNTARYPNVRHYNIGLWSGPDTVRFVSSARAESYGARIQCSDSDATLTYDVEIPTTSIDDALATEKVSLIKMDIEGAETAAVQGAADTIATHAPKLALSVYHRLSDLYEIPLQINQYCPSYRLYLRHFSNFFDDTILLATL